MMITKKSKPRRQFITPNKNNKKRFTFPTRDSNDVTKRDTESSIIPITTYSFEYYTIKIIIIMRSVAFYSWKPYISFISITWWPIWSSLPTHSIHRQPKSIQSVTRSPDAIKNISLLRKVFKKRNKKKRDDYDVEWKERNPKVAIRRSGDSKEKKEKKKKKEKRKKIRKR